MEGKGSKEEEEKKNAKKAKIDLLDPEGFVPPPPPSFERHFSI